MTTEKRNYPNFIEAYKGLFDDGFVPPQFTEWAAISVVAAALERKVWLPWGNFKFFPNMYILFVAKPGIGKSSAINPAVGMLRDLKQHGEALNILPSQITEAKLIDLMAKNHRKFTHGTTVKEQCAGYFYASEASACLKDLYGGFINTITSFYDCDDNFQKATMGGGERPTNLRNICFNLLAGSTFDYLGKLITDDNIMGGFASRLTYIIQEEYFARDMSWESRGAKNSKKIDRYKLMQDLAKIQSIVGPYSADKEFAGKWNKWAPEFDKFHQSQKNEKLQSLLARKPTIIRKLPMIISAAESGDRVLRGHHWDRAMELMNEAEKQLPIMLREGRARDTKSQTGLNNALIRFFERNEGDHHLHSVMHQLTLDGYDRDAVYKTVISLSQNKVLFDYNEQTLMLKLIGDSQAYL